MPEIEKKYLLLENRTEHITKEFFEIYGSFQALWEDAVACGVPVKQGYLPVDLGIRLAEHLGERLEFKPEECRLREMGGEYFFTLKSAGGLSRDELEKRID